MLDSCQFLLDGILGAGIDHFALKGCTLGGPEDKARKRMQLPPGREDSGEETFRILNSGEFLFPSSSLVLVVVVFEKQGFPADQASLELNRHLLASASLNLGTATTMPSSALGGFCYNPNLHHQDRDNFC